jgi:hypothetical protein
LSGSVVPFVDDRVQSRVHVLEPGDGGIDELRRRDATAADKLGLSRRIKKSDISHIPNPPTDSAWILRWSIRQFSSCRVGPRVER